MQVQLEKVQPVHGADLGADCLCPPVCFQCPPPFCLPCGPGPSGAAPEGVAECMPPPRQCGPFMMLNTPMERKIVLVGNTEICNPCNVIFVRSLQNRILKMATDINIIKITEITATMLIVVIKHTIIIMAVMMTLIVVTNHITTIITPARMTNVNTIETEKNLRL